MVLHMRDLKPWKVLRRRLLLDRSPWMRVLEHDVLLPDGRLVEGYLRVEVQSYVIIVPIDEAQRVGLVRSYKHGVEAVDIQPPAGIIEPGETPQQAAMRELREEMGCTAENWHPLGDYVISGNYRAGRAHVFLATGCRTIAAPEAGDLEEQEIIWLAQEDLRRRLEQHRFAQIDAVAALSLAMHHLQKPNSGQRPDGREASA